MPNTYDAKYKQNARKSSNRRTFVCLQCVWKHPRKTPQSVFCAVFTVGWGQLQQRWMLFSYQTLLALTLPGDRGLDHSAATSYARLAVASSITTDMLDWPLWLCRHVCSRSIFFCPETDSRPPRSKRPAYSPSVIKILLASTFDNMCHKTGLEQVFTFHFLIHQGAGPGN